MHKSNRTQQTSVEKDAAAAEAVQPDCDVTEQAAAQLPAPSPYCDVTTTYVPQVEENPPFREGWWRHNDEGRFEFLPEAAWHLPVVSQDRLAAETVRQV